MKHLLLFAVALGLLLPPQAFSAPPPAQPESLTMAGKRAKVVAKAALYGTGGGLVVGLASQVFRRKTKNIFVFGSLGLYAGIILGLYVVSTSRGPTPYEGPDTYEDYGDFSKIYPSQDKKIQSASAKEIHVNLVNLTF